MRVSTLKYLLSPNSIIPIDGSSSGISVDMSSNDTVDIPELKKNDHTVSIYRLDTEVKGFTGFRMLKTCILSGLDTQL